ncbi:helix-turn-helix domain-containing protein [Psychrobacter faecalis]
MYELLKRIDMSWISARSQHPKADPQAQDAFKKTL